MRQCGQANSATAVLGVFGHSVSFRDDYGNRFHNSAAFGCVFRAFPVFSVSSKEAGCESAGESEKRDYFGRRNGRTARGGREARGMKRFSFL